MKRRFLISALVFASFALFISLISPRIRVVPEDFSSLPVSRRFPSAYVVNGTYDTASKDQGRRPFSSFFSLIGLLEGQYRAQGLARRALSSNESYVFSVQAFANYTHTICSRSDAPVFCEHIDDKLPAVFPYLLQYDSTLKKSIVANQTCEYRNDLKCDGLDAMLKLNPFEFEAELVHWGQSVSQIKEMLNRTRRPILLSMPKPLFNVLRKCTDNCTRKCGDGECSIESYPAMKLDGSYFVPQAPAELRFSGYETFLIYGWNDEIITTTGQTYLRSYKPTMGGFIAKSWRGTLVGHSIGYYLGLLGSDEEEVMCPNRFNAFNWVPAHINSTFPANFSKCDRLYCTNSQFCNVSASYALVAAPGGHHMPVINEDEFGNPTVKMFEVGSDNSSKMVDIKGLPFHMLQRAFVPYKYEANEAHLCSYSFIPYELIDLLRLEGNDVFNRVMAYDFRFNFTDKSFPKKRKKSSNFAFLNASRVEIPERRLSRYISDEYYL